MAKTIFITGGAGFIVHVVRLFVNKYPDYKIVNVDADLCRNSKILPMCAILTMCLKSRYCRFSSH